MQEPVPPRLEEFGIAPADAARLAPHVLPPPALDPAPGASVLVRWLNSPRLLLLGAVPAGLWSLHAMLSGGHADGWDISVAVLAAVVLAAPVGMMAAAFAGLLVLRPLYGLVAGLVIPHFRAYRRFERAQDAYSAKRLEYEAYRRRLSLEFWRSLSGLEFERECAALFQRMGYQATLTPGTADGGIDILLRSAEGITAVQCKALAGKVGVGVGRELVTAARDIGAERMMIACTRGASEPLRRYAREKGITLVTAEHLVEWQLRLKSMHKVTLQVERIHPAVDQWRRSPGGGLRSSARHPSH